MRRQRRNPNAVNSFNNNNKQTKREIHGKQRNLETGTQNKTQKQELRTRLRNNATVKHRLTPNN